MKSFFCFAAVGILAVGASAMAKEGSFDPTGTWLVEDGLAKVHIEKCGSKHVDLCGTIVWIKDGLDEKGQPKTDIKNPDPAKRSRPTLGMPLFAELKPDDEDVYAGEIYNAENGKNYDVTLKMEKATELRLKGCVLSLLCQSQHWTRTADLPSTVVAATQGKAKKVVTPAQ